MFWQGIGETTLLQRGKDRTGHTEGTKWGVKRSYGIAEASGGKLAELVNLQVDAWVKPLLVQQRWIT